MSTGMQSYELTLICEIELCGLTCCSVEDGLGLSLNGNSPLWNRQKPGDGGNAELLLGRSSGAKSSYFHLSECRSLFNCSQNVDKLLGGTVHTTDTQGG